MAPVLGLSTDSPTNSKRTGFTFRGKEIVLSKTRGRPFSGLVAKGMERGMYPEQKRLEVVSLFAATGNFKQVSELTSVPVPTIKVWRKQDWFQELLKEIRDENNEKIDAKFTEIIENALEQVADRVQNGDFVVTPRGDLIRRPIPAKDLSLVVAINVDKRQLLRGEPTNRTEDKVSVPESVVNRLDKLAKTFEDLAKHGRKPRTLEVKDAEVVELVESGAGAFVPAKEGHKKDQVSQGTRTGTEG